MVTDSSERIMLGVRLPASLFWRVKEGALRRHLSVQELAVQALEREIAREEDESAA